MMRFATFAAAALALAGCVSTSCPPSSKNAASNTAVAAAAVAPPAVAPAAVAPAAVAASTAPGFYRHANELSVYRVAQNSACLVASAKQMQAFGGFSLVKVVPPTVDFLARARRPIPVCVMPAAAR